MSSDTDKTPLNPVPARLARGSARIKILARGSLARGLFGKKTEFLQVLLGRARLARGSSEIKILARGSLARGFPNGSGNYGEYRLE